MEVVKKTKEFTIVKKKNGRYGVQVKRKWVNGDDKVKILLDAGLSKVAVKKEAPAEVTPAE